jgi:predicted AlkP superfamily pyrophosphatase or phosphodiesterase
MMMKALMRSTMITLFLIDGLRPDAIDLADCPNLKALRARSSSTMQASSVMPSITLPCHTSIFHSVTPERHGITSNEWHPMARPLPGLFDVAKAAGKTTAFFYNWEQLRDISRPGSLDLSFCANNSYDPDGDSVVAKYAAENLSTGKYDFAFVYFGNVDSAGHIHTWMSDGYLNQISITDKALGTVLDALPADSTVLLQSDHGGHDRTHGTTMPEDMTIPWMVAGPNIRQGYTIQEPVSLLNTAPTLARLLGVTPHRDWEGKCIEEIFIS